MNRTLLLGVGAILLAGASFFFGANYTRILSYIAPPGDPNRISFVGLVSEKTAGGLTLEVENQDFTNRFNIIVATNTPITLLPVAQTLATLETGTTVVVYGTRNPDGSVTAQLIREVPPPKAAPVPTP